MLRIFWRIIALLFVFSCCTDIEKPNYFRHIVFDSVLTTENQIHLQEILEPTAIEFFELLDFVETATILDESVLDSAEIWIEENRQQYYTLHGNNYVYNHYIVDRLDSINVNRISVDKSIGYVKFETTNRDYFLNLNKIKEFSGVLFFNGKDAPIFWDSDNYSEVFVDFIVNYLGENNKETRK